MEEKKNSKYCVGISVRYDDLEKLIPVRQPALDPSEIMMGDLVVYKGGIVEVIGIWREGDTNKWNVQLVGSEGFYFFAELSDIYPIELTDKILNLYAEWDDEKNCYWINSFIKIRIVNNRIVHDDIILESLGDLQHLLKLYGVNLK